MPVVLPVVQPRVTFDLARDFSPIAQVGTFPFVIAVRPDHPARDVRELVARVHANPSRANFGTVASGSLVHQPHEMPAPATQSSRSPAAISRSAWGPCWISSRCTAPESCGSSRLGRRASAAPTGHPDDQ